MRLALTGAVAAGVTMAGVGLGQVTSVRPARLVPVQVEPVTLADVQRQVGTLSAQVAQDHQQIATLTAQLQKQQQLIGDLQIGLKSTTVRGFDTAGQVSALSGQVSSLTSTFNNHSHYYTVVSESGGKQFVAAALTTIATQFCKKNNSASTGSNAYTCTAP